MGFRGGGRLGAVRAAAVAAAAAVVAVTALSGRAEAAQLTGPPSPDGYYGQCGYGLQHADDSLGNHWFVFRARCNVGGSGGSYNAANWFLNTVDQSYNGFNSSQTGQLVGTVDQGTVTCGTAGPIHRYQTWYPATLQLETQWCFGIGAHQASPFPWALNYPAGQAYRTATVNYTGAWPQYPPDYYAGGQAGPLSDAVPGSATCSRVLTQNNASNVATFTGGSTGQANATVAFGWDFGDSAASAAQNPQHVYAALSSQPSGGWTATETVTSTAAAGHLFADGTTVKTATCSVRVDFLSPEQSAPGSTGVDKQEDSQCPTGFGWLNPLAIVRILRCAFVPDWPQVGAAVDSLRNSAATREPFTWLTTISDTVDAFGRFLNYDGYCGRMYLFMGDQNHIPGVGQAGVGCEDGDTVSGAADAARTIMAALIWYGVGYRIYATAPWHHGGDTGVPG